jgi:hypothetical protein
MMRQVHIEPPAVMHAGHADFEQSVMITVE